jgi:hypothetical protein
VDLGAELQHATLISRSGATKRAGRVVVFKSGDGIGKQELSMIEYIEGLQTQLNGARLTTWPPGVSAASEFGLKQ